jgi:hypothetical protein
MQKLDLECACDDSLSCPACKQWAKHHSALHRELKLKPWEWFAVEHPDHADPPSPDNPDDGGPVERYRALEQAAKGLVHVRRETRRST